MGVGGAQLPRSLHKHVALTQHPPGKAPPARPLLRTHAAVSLSEQEGAKEGGRRLHTDRLSEVTWLAPWNFWTSCLLLP